MRDEEKPAEGNEDQQDGGTVRCHSLLGCQVPSCAEELAAMDAVARVCSTASYLAHEILGNYPRDAEATSAALAVKGALSGLGGEVCMDTAVRSFVADAIAQAYYAMLAEGWHLDEWQDTMRGRTCDRLRRVFEISRTWTVT